jgi:SAM-dependent MidA family methyltransferase
MKHLPQPDPLSQAHSDEVKQFILQQIKASPQQRLTFADYMHHALYAPGLGYYSAGNHKLGAEGDFVTAPEISALFSQCLARQCAQLLEAMPQAAIIEFGAGSGVMAADILLTLENLQRLPRVYYIVDVSAELKQRQRQTLQQHCPHLLPYVQWLPTLPEQKMQAIILANEVLDAMPVHYFAIDKDALIKEYYVTQGSHGDLQWQLGEPSSDELQKNLHELASGCLAQQSEYCSEICLWYQPWLNSVSSLLEQGVVLLIDYGFPQQEYYLPERRQGTLKCHFRHHSHDDPLIYPGIQDITAHVDFTRVAQSAYNANFEVKGFTTQAHFLLDCGLVELMPMESDSAAKMVHHNAIKQLTLPTEMGELFKVLALTRNLETPLLGFQSFNRLHQL